MVTTSFNDADLSKEFFGMHKLTGLLLLSLFGLVHAAPTVAQVSDGMVTDAYLDGFRDRRTPAYNDMYIYVLGSRGFVETRPCAAGVEVNEIQEPLRLEHPEIELAPRHMGDLTCAFAERGHIVIARRPTGEGREVLYIDYDGNALLEVEIVHGATAQEIASVALVSTQLFGQMILFEDRPPEARDLIGRSRFQDLRGTPNAGLAFLKNLAGLGEFELAALGLNAVEVSDLSKPLMACGIAKRDSAVLRNLLFDQETKEIVCDRLETYQTERHAKGPPNNKTARRLLILALARSFPESDTLHPNGTRLIYEHSSAGIRMAILNNRLPNLSALPRISVAVRKATVRRCTGPESGPITCRVTAEVERFGAAGNTPNSFQKELLETLLGGDSLYEVELDLDLERKGVRWEVSDDAAVAAALMNFGDATVIRGFSESLLQGLRAQ